MSLTKRKTVIVSLAAVAVMSLGSISAMAVSTGLSLTPAGNFDPSKANITPGTCSVVEGVTPHIEDGQTATTAPNPTLTDDSGTTVTALPGTFDASEFLGKNFTIKTLDPQELHPLTPGQHYTTAAK
jgi:hypothetical protein